MPHSPPDIAKPRSLTTRDGKLLMLVFGLSAVTVGTKLLGFAEKIVVAHYFGTTHVADVYFAVVALAISLVFLLRELVYPSLLPVFTRALATSPDSTAGLFKRCLFTAGAILICIGIPLSLQPRIFLTLLLPGFTPAQQNTAAPLIRSLGPAIAFLGLMTVTSAALNARRRFVISALGDFTFKFLLIAGYIVLVPAMGISCTSLVMGACALLALLFHLIFLPDSRHILTRGSEDSSRLFRDVLKLACPLILGVLFSHFTDLMDNLLASRLPTGQLSCLTYAKKLVDAILLVGPVVFVTITYPRLSDLAARNRNAEFTATMLNAFRIILFITVPLACLLIQLRIPINQVLFQHGRFDLTSTLGTSTALSLYALGLPVLALDGLLVHSFFALQDTRTPVIIGIACAILNIVLAILLSHYLQYLGIAFALILSKTVKIAILYSLLARQIEGFKSPTLFRFMAKLLTTTLVLARAVHCMTPAESGATPLYRVALRHLLMPTLAGLTTFTVAAWLMKIQEARQLITLCKDRFIPGE